MPQILVVDDSQTFRLLLRSMLEPAGYTIREAADGIEALEALHATAEPLVVLLDYRMPNMDGWQVLQAVDAEGPPITNNEFVVVSAEIATFPLDRVELLRHLSIRTLPKPFEKSVLLNVVAQAQERLSASPDVSLFNAPDA